MRKTKGLSLAVTLVFIALTTGCAGMETLVSAPGVSLRHVEPRDLDFSGQTFVLRFDVTNPNPFPLPVSSVAYAVRLDGERFASGKAPSAFTIAALSDGEFVITVELDLLRTAPKLLYVLRDSTKRDIPYALEGEFGVDLPYVRPVAFQHSGEIALTVSGLSARLP